MLRLRSTILGNFRFKGKQLASIAMNHPDRSRSERFNCDLLMILYEYLKKSTISLADCRYLPPNTTRQKGCDTAFRAPKGLDQTSPQRWMTVPANDRWLRTGQQLDEWRDVKKVHYTVHIDVRFTLEGEKEKVSGANGINEL